MGIRVNYSPVGGIGQLSTFAGQQAGISRALQDSLSISSLMQRERMHNQSLAANIWGRQFDAAVGQQNRREQMAFNANQAGLDRSFRAQQAGADRAFALQQQQQQRFDRVQMLQAEEGMRNRLANADFVRQMEMNRVRDEQTQQMYEMRLSEPQRRQRMELENRVAWVQGQNNWSPEQKQDAIGQLQQQWLGIQPMPQQAEEPPWPIEESPGLIFEKHGQLWTREIDANGNIKLENHGVAPGAHNDDRQIDRQPFRRGMGVYQYNEAGKLETVVPPPKMPGPDFYADIFKDVAAEMAASAPIPEEGGLAAPVPPAQIHAEAQNRVDFIMQQMQQQHELLIQQMLGAQEGGTTGGNPDNNFLAEPKPDMSLMPWSGREFNPYMDSSIGRGDNMQPSFDNATPMTQQPQQDPYTEDDVRDGTAWADIRQQQDDFNGRIPNLTPRQAMDRMNKQGDKFKNLVLEAAREMQ